jgi:hypothetical protein
MAVTAFSVSPDANAFWRVARDGSDEVHTFADRHLALNYARAWAEANGPSRVVVRAADGTTEAQWEYPAYFGLRRILGQVSKGTPGRR